MKQLLTARDLSFSFPSRKVLDGVSFDVHAGDMVAVVGANGAGKTTLLKILCGLLEPGAGDVRLLDRPLGEKKPRELARCIAMVPQEIQVSFDFTVQEFVEQGRTPYLGKFFGGFLPRDREAVCRALELASVQHLAERKFSGLSGGERQRVKIALALAQEPQLLLLDEPSQHLDIGRQAEVFTVLHRLNESGMTIVAAMHDLHNVYEHFALSLVLRPDFSFAYGSPGTVLTPEALQEVYGPHPPAAWLNGIPTAAGKR
jgi:iron complex transport system ATP-binding protein